MNKEAMMELARTLGVPLKEAEAELQAKRFAHTKEMLENMKQLPLENVEPALWFVTKRRGSRRKQAARLR